MSRKYQTMESIFDAIDRDYAWRLVELSEIKKAVQVAKGRAVATEIRKGILLLYAHWEGFIKFVSTEYLQYIVDQKFKQSELTDNFRCILFKKKLHIYFIYEVFNLSFYLCFFCFFGILILFIFI